MQSLIEIQKEIDGEFIDEDLCIDLIKRGNEIKGYGLYLAKEVVHKDSNTGWEEFCNKIGVTKQNANRLILFYKAKSEPIGSDLPNKESVYRELPGNTPEEKAEMFGEAKMITDKDEPTALDVRVIKKVKARASSQRIENEAIDYLNTASAKVREAWANDPKPAVGRLLKAAKEGLSDEEIIDSFGEKVGGAKRKKLSQKDKVFIERFEESADMLFRFFLNVENINKKLKKIKAQNKVEYDKLIAKAGTALDTFEINIEEFTKMGSADLKAYYRELARENHPDKGGDHNVMADITDAYNKLKTMIERRE